MRAIKRAVISAIGSIFLFGSASALEMKGAQIKALISGKSVYLENIKPSAGDPGRGVIYFAEDGKALRKNPSGTTYHGTWTIKGDAGCVEWKELRGLRCSRYDKQGTTIVLFNDPKGLPRSKIAKIVPGNAEKLGP